MDMKDRFNEWAKSVGFIHIEERYEEDIGLFVDVWLDTKSNKKFQVLILDDDEWNEGNL